MPASAKTTAKKTPAKKAGASVKPAAKKPVKAVAAKPAAEKPKLAKPATKRGNSGVSAERRRNYIEVAAYYIAERRGFGGDALADWAAAETEIDRLLTEGLLSP